MFSSRPVERSSIATTEFPSLTSSSLRWLPIKPAPRQLLQQQRAHVPATVEPHVDQQAIVIDPRTIVNGKLAGRWQSNQMSTLMIILALFACWAAWKSETMFSADEVPWP